MKIISLVAAVIFIAACASKQSSAPPESAASVNSSQTNTFRTPSSVDLTGAYLGEGLFAKKRPKAAQGLKRPAMRFYLERNENEADSYYGVLVEYDELIKMAPPYLAAQKAPGLNESVGFLDKIATRISAYKVVSGSRQGSYDLYNLEVQNGQIASSSMKVMELNLDPNNTEKNLLAGAKIIGNKDGEIIFPKQNKGLAKIADYTGILTREYYLAKFTYKIGSLGSTWRGKKDKNGVDTWEKTLEGSYLPEYGRYDRVLELYKQGDHHRAKFVKAQSTPAEDFTNPKSASIEGDYYFIEKPAKIFLLVPVNGNQTDSDREMTGRIGLFLDVFDGSAPKAGNKLVTELAFVNPKDPEDFMMYYQHPKHLRNMKHGQSE